jgi:hypothetical protein
LRRDGALSSRSRIRPGGCAHLTRAAPAAPVGNESNQMDLRWVYGMRPEGFGGCHAEAPGQDRLVRTRGPRGHRPTNARTDPVERNSG